jgi:hypothetical protein
MTGRRGRLCYTTLSPVNCVHQLVGLAVGVVLQHPPAAFSIRLRPLYSGTGSLSSAYIFLIGSSLLTTLNVILNVRWRC